MTSNIPKQERCWCVQQDRKESDKYPCQTFEDNDQRLCLNCGHTKACHDNP